MDSANDAENNDTTRQQHWKLHLNIHRSIYIIMIFWLYKQLTTHNWIRLTFEYSHSDRKGTIQYNTTQHNIAFNQKYIRIKKTEDKTPTNISLNSVLSADVTRIWKYRNSMGFETAE